VRRRPSLVAVAVAAALASPLAMPAAAFACSRYRVQRRYKGRVGSKVWVRTVRDGASCGLTTRRRVALYLDRLDGAWHAGLCSTTSEAAIRAVVRRDRSAQTAAVAACRRPA
jgi:hypothetical protein